MAESVIQELSNTLRRGIDGIEAVFSEAEEETHLEQLLKIINKGGAETRDYEEFGKTQTNLQRFRELRDSARVAISLPELIDSLEDVTEAEEEMRTAVAGMREFLLERKFTGAKDSNNAIIVAHGGVGWGPQLSEYMHNLLLAYSRFAKMKGFNVDFVDFFHSERDATIRVIGENAYGFFRGEHGRHRFFYFNQNDVKHTGYVSIIVEPERENEKYEMLESDLRFEAFGASTPGGQNANTTNSGIRITHTPTGITATQRGRSRLSNISMAKSVLRSRVINYMLSHNEENSTEDRAIPIRGGAHLRTYGFANEGYIKDHRTKIQTTDISSFMKGDIDEFIFAYHGIEEL